MTQTTPPTGTMPTGVPQIDFYPGPEVRFRQIQNPFDGNVHAIGEGRRLYNAFNCSGCHFNGGGGIGPPLMDDEWIYGSSSAQIYSSIVEGRAQGMPAYAGRIPEYQLWQIVAYVRSLSGLSGEAASQPIRSPAEQPRAVEAVKESPGEHPKGGEDAEGQPPGGQAR